MTSAGPLFDHLKGPNQGDKHQGTAVTFQQRQAPSLI